MWSLGTEKPRFIGVKGCLVGEGEKISSHRPAWHPVQALCSDWLCALARCPQPLLSLSLSLSLSSIALFPLFSFSSLLDPSCLSIPPLSVPSFLSSVLPFPCLSSHFFASLLSSFPPSSISSLFLFISPSSSLLFLPSCLCLLLSCPLPLLSYLNSLLPSSPGSSSTLPHDALGLPRSCVYLHTYICVCVCVCPSLLPCVMACLYVGGWAQILLSLMKTSPQYADICLSGARSVC